MSTHKVSITGDGKPGYQVVVDGVDLSKGLVGISLQMEVDRVPELTLDIQLVDVTELKDIEAKVILGAGAHDALVALGWRPPSDGSTAVTDGDQTPGG